MNVNRLTRWTMLSLLAPLAACGSGTSTAELKLMDAPPSGVTAVNVYVAAMQVHVAGSDSSKDGDPNDSSIDDDSSWETLTVGRSIDLVQHQGEAAADVLGQLELPEGKITQLRLLIDTTQPNTAVKDGVSCDLDLSKVEKKGIKINHPFKAFQSKDGEKHEIYVDFRLDESLKASGTCFELKPVIKLHKVKTDGKEVTTTSGNPG